jgi:chromosome segregation ATPase
MVKKGVLGAGLGAAALALLFGTTKAWNYTRYACNTVRESVQAAVPFEVEIDAARQQVRSLDPAIEKGIEALAKLEENVKELQGDILAFRGNFEREKREILALRGSLDSGTIRRTSGVTAECCEIKADLARRMDSYHRAKQTLAAKEETLRLREKEVTAAYKSLDEMKAQRHTLLSQIDEIEARHKALEASRTFNEFQVDTSALAQVKQTVAELNKRANIEARTSELQGRFADKRVEVKIDPSRDVVKEVDDEFGTPTADPGRTTAEKNL